MRSSTIAASTAAALLLSQAVVASPAQSVFQVEQTQPATSSTPVTVSRKPFGRFLHVTDLHPDTHYKHGSAVNSACHHKKPKKSKPDGKQRAGWWGTGLSDCDSPPRLVESSLAWASRNLFQPALDDADTNSTTSSGNLGLDFIIWTGDSARHDNDNRLPRSSKEIFDLNKWTLQQLELAFPGVPLIPTVGNNDIFPHNILFPGPNTVTKEYVSIWQDHIPEYEFHTFEQGGYYVKELLPNRLAAMSLNTLYFYDNNKAVDGCTKRGKGKDVDPGTAQLDWLEVQLKLFRERGMQVHLMGHVPPTAGNYFERCYRRYTDIALRFQDTVVGQHFGHMNTDAFFVQEDEEEARAQVADVAQGEGEVHVKEEGLPGDLRQDYSTLPGKGRTNEDMYSVFYIAPSIVPTYYPSIRLWTYNTTEEGRYIAATSPAQPAIAVEEDIEEEDENEDEEDLDSPFRSLSRHHHRPTPPKKRKGKKHKKKRRALPRHASPDSPSRTNTYLSLLGYSQWVMDIDEQNAAIEEILHPKKHADAIDIRDKKDGRKRKHDKHGTEEEKKRRRQAEKQQVEYRLEYATYPPEVLWSEYTPSSTPVTGPVPKALLELELRKAGLQDPFTSSEVDVEKKHGSHKKLAKPLRKFTDYALSSATIGEMMDLARRLMVDKKLWKRFKRRIYAESGYTP